MNVPSELKYTENEEWIKLEGKVGTVGITDHAQEQLSDIVFVEIVVAVGDEVKQGETCATLESVKAAADVYLPVSGKVVAINEALPDTPELVNRDPYGGAWMVKIELSDPGELGGLMDAAGLRGQAAGGGIGTPMFIPHTDADREAMLQAIGAASIAELFQRRARRPSLSRPEPASSTDRDGGQQPRCGAIAGANESARDLVCFLGAGAYNHFIPAAVDSILRRGEFYTAYTPYQPEISQGTLQAIFDYQSLIAALTGMDVSNASHYDGATAVAEAVSLAYANFRGKRSKVVLSPGRPPALPPDGAHLQCHQPH